MKVDEGEERDVFGITGVLRENFLISNLGGECSEKVSVKSKLGVYIELSVMIIFLQTRFTSETYKIT